MEVLFWLLPFLLRPTASARVLDALDRTSWSIATTSRPQGVLLRLHDQQVLALGPGPPTAQTIDRQPAKGALEAYAGLCTSFDFANDAVAAAIVPRAS